MMTLAPIKNKIQIVTIANHHLLLLQFMKAHQQGFQNITGSVEMNESFIKAAERELKEETGIIGQVEDIHCEFSFHDQWGADVLEKVFLCQIKKIPPITLSLEHQSFKWIKIEDVTLHDFSFASNFEAFKKALEFIKK